MATHRIPILGVGTKPDTQGNVTLDPFDTHATNDVWDRLVFAFADSAVRNGLHGGFAVPTNYVDTANLVIMWTTAAITNDVEWDFDYRAVGGNDTESLDQAGTQETVNSNDTAPSAAFERLEFSIALTDANFLADDEVTFTLFRDSTDAGDTLADEALLFGLYFEYNDA